MSYGSSKSGSSSGSTPGTVTGCCLTPMPSVLNCVLTGGDSNCDLQLVFDPGNLRWIGPPATEDCPQVIVTCFSDGENDPDEISIGVDSAAHMEFSCDPFYVYAENLVIDGHFFQTAEVTA